MLDLAKLSNLIPKMLANLCLQPFTCHTERMYFKLHSRISSVLMLISKNHMPYPLLRLSRWVHNAAGTVAALSLEQKLEGIRRHKDAGEWGKAIRLAQAADFSPGEMDTLYTSAVNYVAPHAVPLKQGGLRGLPNAIEPEVAQELSLQWCLCVADSEKMAELCMMHLSNPSPFPSPHCITSLSWLSVSTFLQIETSWQFILQNIVTQKSCY